MYSDTTYHLSSLKNSTIWYKCITLQTRKRQAKITQQHNPFFQFKNWQTDENISSKQPVLTLNHTQFEPVSTETTKAKNLLMKKKTSQLSLSTLHSWDSLNPGPQLTQKTGNWLPKIGHISSTELVLASVSCRRSLLQLLQSRPGLEGPLEPTKTINFFAGNSLACLSAQLHGTSVDAKCSLNFSDSK